MRFLSIIVAIWKDFTGFLREPEGKMSNKRVSTFLVVSTFCYKWAFTKFLPNITDFGFVLLMAGVITAATLIKLKTNQEFSNKFSKEGTE